jgi:hypothetical protein
MPGRVRVRVPHLQRLPKKYQGVADGIASLLAEPDEIESVSASLTTGNALIRFDPSRATEEDVLRYLGGVLEVFIRNRERFEGLPAERLPAVFGRLKESMRRAVRPRLRVDTAMILEDDVLA